MIDIDIIIPVYNSKNTINRTLYSILYQSYKYKHVYLINDCDNYDYSDEVRFFSNFFDIKEYRMEKNGGPGAARQYGLEVSKGKYVTFVDSDDVFNTPYALKILVEGIEKDYDLVATRIILQWGDELVHSDNYFGSLHGKVFRRKFIFDNHVIFNPARLINEDGTFNQVCFRHDARVDFIDTPIYVRLDNGDSLTHHMNYSYQSEIDCILQMYWVLELGIKENWSKDQLETVERFLINYVCQNYMKLENKELVDDARNKIRDYKKEYITDNRALVSDFINGFKDVEKKSKDYIIRPLIKGFDELYK